MQVQGVGSSPPIVVRDEHQEWFSVQVLVLRVRLLLHYSQVWS